MANDPFLTDALHDRYSLLSLTGFPSIMCSDLPLGFVYLVDAVRNFHLLCILPLVCLVNPSSAILLICSALPWIQASFSQTQIVKLTCVVVITDLHNISFSIPSHTFNFPFFKKNQSTGSLLSTCKTLWYFKSNICLVLTVWCHKVHLPHRNSISHSSTNQHKLICNLPAYLIYLQICQFLQFGVSNPRSFTAENKSLSSPAAVHRQWERLISCFIIFSFFYLCYNLLLCAINILLCT